MVRPVWGGGGGRFFRFVHPMKVSRASHPSRQLRAGKPSRGGSRAAGPQGSGDRHRQLAVAPRRATGQMHGVSVVSPTRDRHSHRPRGHTADKASFVAWSPGQSHPWGGLCAAPSMKEKLHLLKAERGPWRAQAWDNVPREARVTCERLFLVGPQPPLTSRPRAGARAGGVVPAPWTCSPRGLVRNSLCPLQGQLRGAATVTVTHAHARQGEAGTCSRHSQRSRGTRTARRF